MPSASTTAARTPPSRRCPLTRRELEILADVAVGRGNRTIGSRLGITERTVKNHLSNIMRELHTTDRTAAVVLALRNGWLELKALDVIQREDGRGRDERGVA